jgi:hypothetical protein
MREDIPGKNKRRSLRPQVHLHRYLAEFDFRYSNRIGLGVDDQDRADKAIRGMVGKRLTYRGPSPVQS